MSIKLNGPRDEGTLNFLGEDTGGKCVYSELELQLEGTGETIDLRE